jgi:hypothetical protein
MIVGVNDYWGKYAQIGQRPFDPAFDRQTTEKLLSTQTFYRATIFAKIMLRPSLVDSTIQILPNRRPPLIAATYRNGAGSRIAI